MEKIIEQVKKNKKVLIGIFLVCVFGYYLIWVITQPFNMAPDEAMKYDICNYLYKNNKLPLGTDEAIRDKLWGISYAFQPILTYMVGAIFMKIMSIFSTEQFALVVAARLVSTLSMTAVIYFVIKISEKLFKGIYKYLFVTMIAFLPLTAFLASYINNDSTAVLATAIIVYCWILGLESNWKNVHCAWLGIGIGFCALTYYNAYGYILCSIIICLATTISDKMKAKEIGKKALIVALIAMAIAGWWFIRNAIIYNGDFLGLQAEEKCAEEFAQEKYKPSQKQTMSKLCSIQHMLIRCNWIEITIKSFVGIFGYHTIKMANIIYYYYDFIWIIGIIGCFMRFKELMIFDKKEKNKYIFNYTMFLAMIIPVFLSIYYSYTNDFQPQGRYIMPMIIPFTYFIVTGLQGVIEKFIKSEKVKKALIIILMISIIVISFIAIFGYVMPVYKDYPKIVGGMER